MRVGAGRAWPALGWIAAAIVLAAAVVYLRPSPTPPATTPAPAAARAAGRQPADRERLVRARRGGVVTVVRGVPQRGGTRATYLTSDGGRTWRVSSDSVTPVGESRVVRLPGGPAGGGAAQRGRRADLAASDAA